MVMDFLWWIIGLAIWIAIAFWPARVASRKGHSFWMFFILSLIFFPLSIILAYVVKDKKAPKQAAAPTETSPKEN